MLGMIAQGWTQKGRAQAQEVHVGKLTNISVSFISLVKAGANRKTIIWKSSDPKASEGAAERVIPFAKVDEDKRLVLGIVYSPGQVDTQGDWAEAPEIEKAAHGFLKASAQHNIDKQHDFVPAGAFVAESWITKQGDPLFPNEPAGSWAVAIKVEDDELWKQVKTGEVKGLSMAGCAMNSDAPAPAAKSEGADESLFRRVVAAVQKLISKQEDDSMEKKEVQVLVDEAMKPINEKLEALSKSVEQIAKGAKADDKEKGEPKMEDVVKGAVEAAMKPVNERLEAIEKATKGSGQDDGDKGDSLGAFVKALNEKRG